MLNNPYTNAGANQLAYAKKVEANNELNNNEAVRKDNYVDEFSKNATSINNTNRAAIYAADQAEITNRNAITSMRNSANMSLLDNLSIDRKSANQQQVDEENRLLNVMNYDAKSNGAVTAMLDKLSKNKINSKIQGRLLKRYKGIVGQ
jgi:hypothetical protein